MERTQSITVAVHLPRVERYSPVTGGALATWVNNVYRHCKFDVRVFGTPVNDSQRYREPAFVPCGTSKIADRLEEAIRHRRLRGLLDRPKHWLANRQSRKIAHAMSPFSPEIIHVQNDILSIPLIRRRNARSKIILHMQNDFLIDCPELHAQDAIVGADLICFCSEYLRGNAIRCLGDIVRDKSFVIYNGARLRPGMRKVDGAKRIARILFAGRLVPEKGVHVLIASMRMVLKQLPDARLDIVGGVNFGDNRKTTYLKELETQAAEFAGSIRWHGAVPHSGMAAYYEDADIFVCPSLWEEPFGMVNVEAMAAGVPVVASARGGIPEAVGDAGILLEDIGPESLANAIVALMLDPNRRRCLSQRGRARVERHFAWPVIAQEWEHRLDALVSAKGCRVN